MSNSTIQESIRETILDTIETSLMAQLRAIKRLRQPENEQTPKSKRGMSQVDIAYDILRKTAHPLHINEILKKIEALHGIHIERESLVSAITKKVQRNDRFIKTAKNTFGIKPE